MKPSAGPPPCRGAQAEDLACRYLEQRGLQVVARNYRCPRGEIDLVMRDGGDVVFVEVRFRRTGRFGGAAETVDARKQSRLIATALHYLQAHRDAAQRPARFDVIAIAPDAGQPAIQWIRNAFQA